jgi:hypothetical protein
MAKAQSILNSDAQAQTSQCGVGSEQRLFVANADREQVEVEAAALVANTDVEHVERRHCKLTCATLFMSIFITTRLNKKRKFNFNGLQYFAIVCHR